MFTPSDELQLAAVPSCMPITLRWFRARCARLVALLLAGLLVPASLAAHELPQRVVVHVLTQQRGDVLRLLVRVPVESLRDIAWPLAPDGVQLRMNRAQRYAEEAAQLWVVPGIVAGRVHGALGSGGHPTTRVVAAVVRAPSDAMAVTGVAPTQSFDATWLTLQREAARSAQQQLSVPVTDRAPVASGERLIPWTHTMLDVALEISAPRASLTTALAHLGVRTTIQLRVHAGSERERVLVLMGDAEAVPLDPSAFDAMRRFVELGIAHILGGIDHLLFVLCLVIPVRRLRPLVGIVTAFTVAHSITLISAALGMRPEGAWFPPLVETVIAASIVLLAVENMVRAPDALERRWPTAFVFGLVHGFGFSFALGESLQLAGSQRLVALAAFNVGVEVGQLAVIAAAFPLLALAVRRISRPRLVLGVASAVVGHAAWHWMVDRGAEVLAYAQANGWLVPLG